MADLEGGCRLGWCATEKVHYGGGYGAYQDIKAGKCPICKGPAEKPK